MEIPAEESSENFDAFLAECEGVPLVGTFVVRNSFNKIFTRLVLKCYCYIVIVVITS